MERRGGVVSRRADDRIAAQRRRALAIAKSPLATVFVDTDGVVSEANLAMEVLAGVVPGGLVGVRCDELLLPLPPALGQRAAGGPQRRVVRRTDGTEVLVAVHSVDLHDRLTGFRGTFLQVEDVTRESRALSELADSRAELAAVVENAVDAIVVMDENGLVVSANAATTEIFGWPVEALVGKPMTRLLPPELRRAHEAGLRRLLTTGQRTMLDQRRVAVEGLHRDGHRVPVELTVREIQVGSHRRFTGTMRDLGTEKRLLERLRRQAVNDPLTGLPNREAVLDIVRAAVRAGTPTAVLVCDLVSLSLVNTTLGHTAGDDLIVAVARRMSEVTDGRQVIGRYRGDELVVVWPGAGPDDGARLAQALVSAMDRPVALSGREVVAAVSVGVALGLPHEHGEVELLRQADTALAAVRGRGGWRQYDEALATTVKTRLDTELDLRRALDRDELEVHYQPVIDLRTLTVDSVSGRRAVTAAGGPGCPWIGVEALVRWRRPGHGLVLPGEFIGVAEASGLIGRLGRRVLDLATTQARHWYDALGDQAPYVAVNVSPLQLADDRVVGEVREALERSGIPPRLLTLEITESALLEPAATGVVDGLTALGVGLAIDDFGTGWSSLMRLSQLPFAWLKVDRSFVAAAVAGGRDAAVLDGILVLARALELGTVIEGVETAEQLELVQAAGADVVQGFLLSRPLSAQAADDLLLGH